MRKTTTAVLAVTAAIPLAFAVATPAAAAPGDVTAEFTTTVNPDGTNSVTGTFSSTVYRFFPGSCNFVSFDSFDPTQLTFGLSAFSIPPTGSVITITDTDVPDGTYTIDWSCTSNYLLGSEEGRGGSLGGGDLPVTLEVPAQIVVPEEPEVPEPEVPETPVCTGSACLPTGSFGF